MDRYRVTSNGVTVGHVFATSSADAVRTMLGAPPPSAGVRAWRLVPVPTRRR